TVEIHDAAVLIGPDVLRIEADGLAEIGERAERVAACLVRMAALAVGKRASGINPDCGVIIVDGPLEVAHGSVSDRPGVVGKSIAGVEPDGCVIVGDRTGEVVPGLVCNAT